MALLADLRINVRIRSIGCFLWVAVGAGLHDAGRLEG